MENNINNYKDNKLQKVRRNSYKKILVLLFVFFIVLIISGVILLIHYNKTVFGNIYFNKPVSWEKAYAKIYKDGDNEYKQIELTQVEDYIYSLKITNKIIDKKENIAEYRVCFNSGDDEEYQITTRFEDYNKIYNIKTGIGTKDAFTMGEWLNYTKELKIGKIPRTSKNIKNVILMIGDGMGENHVLAGEIYKGEKLNIQKIEDKSLVKTESKESITESSAATTAMSTGHKTNNNVLGKDKDGNNLENLTEILNNKGIKTGVVCTQILNHATPAGFIVHNNNRKNYDEIAKQEIKSNINLMLGGGSKYFKNNIELMNENNCKFIERISELKEIKKDERVIGTFAEKSLSDEDNRISLSELTKEALERIKNNKGFFLMIEGSDIDRYSHKKDISKTLTELIDFDDAVGTVMSFVDENPDTLLIITADHETGGLDLNGVYSKEQLNNSLFKKGGQHTNIQVPIYTYGKQDKELTKYDVIDNTSIYYFIKQAFNN